MVTCAECGEPFTDEQWENRHTRHYDGEDIHAECCLVCELVGVFLNATDDLPDDAQVGINAVLTHLIDRELLR